MKLPKQALTRPRSNGIRIPGFSESRLLATSLALGAIVVSAAGQQVLVSPPTVPIPQPERAATETNELATTQGEPTTAPGVIAPPRQPFQWGPLTLHPHLSYQFTYGTGLQSSTNSAHRSVIQTLSPGLGFSLGQHWQLDYTPSLMFYSDKHFKDVVDHSIALMGSASYQDWSFNLAHNTTLTSDPQVETATQTDQELHSTIAGAICQLNSSMALQLGLAQNLRFTRNFENSRDWSTMDWINQQWGPNLGGGLGAGFGYVDVDTGNDMTYEQLQARITWRVVNKISLSVNGGADIRQFLATGTNDAPSDLVSPIFGASISYHPVETTTITLSAGRTVTPSYFENEITETTSVNCAISQRLLKQFYLGLSGGYGYSSFRSSAGGFSTSRTDTYYSFSASLGTAFLKRGTASVFYSYSSNSSNAGGFGYSSDQVGFNIAYRY